MINDTKNSATFTNDVKYSGSIVNEIKNRVTFLATQALDFLMTQDDDYIVIDKSGVMTNQTKH